MKNLKDIEGDRKEGVMTLPVLLGAHAFKVVGGLVFLSVVLVPVFFGMTLVTTLTSIFFGILLYILINKKPFVENHVMYAYFIFFIVVFLQIAVI